MNKKVILAALFCCTVFGFTACDDDDDDDKTVTISFEDFNLDKDTVLLGQSATSHGITFENYYNESQSYNSGFTVSNMTDMETAGYLNQYSVYNKQSTTFAIYNPSYYGNCYIKSAKESATFEPVSVEVCLTTYTYLSAKNGDGYSTPLAEDGWFAATFTGYDANDKVTGSVEVKLIDGTSWMDSWTKISLEELGDVNKILITFDGSDKGDWGLNTPAYVAIDNFVVEED